MLNALLHPLSLPPYHSVERYEGKGNYAIWKYYKFPYRYFYRHKLRMMVDMMDRGRMYRNILDFGSGPGIFTSELRRHALKVKNLDIGEAIDPRWKFDLIICGSVLEFVNLDSTLQILKNLSTENSQIIVASPMQSAISRLYFNHIGDTMHRTTHTNIISAISKKFRIVRKKDWLGLYFCIKAII